MGTIDLADHQKVETAEQLVVLVVKWHDELVQGLREIVALDQNIHFEEVNAPMRMATEEEAYGFRRGITEVLQRLELFFVAVIEDTQGTQPTE